MGVGSLPLRQRDLERSIANLSVMVLPTNSRLGTLHSHKKKISKRVRPFEPNSDPRLPGTVPRNPRADPGNRDRSLVMATTVKRHGQSLQPTTDSAASEEGSATAAVATSNGWTVQCSRTLRQLRQISIAANSRRSRLREGIGNRGRSNIKRWRQHQR